MRPPFRRYAKNPDLTIAEADAVLGALDALRARSSEEALNQLGVEPGALRRATAKIAAARKEGLTARRTQRRRKGEWTTADVERRGLVMDTDKRRRDG